jgi:hypothetical protein
MTAINNTTTNQTAKPVSLRKNTKNTGKGTCFMIQSGLIQKCDVIDLSLLQACKRDFLECITIFNFQFTQFSI